MAKLTIELGVEQLEDAMRKAFNKSKSKFNILDFREGRVSRAMTEEMYDEGIFYEDAADEATSTICIEAMNESGLEIIPRPEVAIDQIGKDKPFIYTATVVVRPEAILDECKGTEVKGVDTVVKSEDVKAELKKVQEQNAGLPTTEDRSVTSGDQTVIGLERFVDGKIFDDGKAADYPLTIGPHSFIDTFEEQLVGRNIGEGCEIDVTFLGEYHAAELAGKPAVLKVTVKEIKVKELPELGDEFAGEVSEFDTLGKYREDVEARILERKQRETAPENENHIADRVVAGVSVEVPSRMVEDQIDNMAQDTARRMESQGLSMDPYMKYTGMTMEQMREQMEPQASRRIQTRLMSKEVVKAENLQVFNERLDEEITKMVTVYQTEADKLRGYMSDHDKGQIREDIAVQEAVDLLAAEAKLV